MLYISKASSLSSSSSSSIINFKYILSFYLYLGFLILFTCIFKTQSKKLIYMQEVFRHGARNPQHSFKQDYSDITLKWKSTGELTTQGKNMHYLLGQKIYQKYWNQLFGGTIYQNQYNQSKIYVKSTNYNRTIQSVQSQLMGILKNLPPLQLEPDSFQFSMPQWPGMNPSSIKKQDWPQQPWLVFGQSGKSYHPLAIHVQKIQSNLYDQGDFLLSYSQELCPKQELWAQQNFNSKKGLEIKNLDSVKQALTALNQALKLQEPVEFQHVYWFIDNYYCLKYMQVKYLTVFQDPKYKDTFHFIYAVGMYLQLFYTHLQRQISTTQFFQVTMDNINKVINDTANEKQLVLFSAHDTTVGAVIAALNFSNVDCLIDYWINKNNKGKDDGTCIVQYPLYTSNIIIELWQDNSSQNKSYTIKILYNGQQRKMPFCNYAYQCSLQAFQDWFQQFKTDDYLRDCGIDNPVWNFWAIISIFICVLVISFGFICYQRKRLQMLMSNSIIMQDKGGDYKEEKGGKGYDPYVDQKQIELNKQTEKGSAKSNQ